MKFAEEYYQKRERSFRKFCEVLLDIPYINYSNKWLTLEEIT